MGRVWMRGEGGLSQRQTFDPEELFHYIKSLSSMQKTYSDRNQSIKLMCCDMMDTL